jgi:hypothetical protein
VATRVTICMGLAVAVTLAALIALLCLRGGGVEWRRTRYLRLAASPVEGKKPMAKIGPGTGLVELDDVGANMQELGDVHDWEKNCRSSQ